MPRNRLDTPREERVAEVVAVADELFLRRGFAKTPMSDIAKAVGVANAAVFWYFPTKDDLLAEVFSRALTEEIDRLRNGPEDPLDRLMQGLVELRSYRQLHMTIHERMSESESVAAVHDRLISWIRTMVIDGLRYRGYEGADEKEVVEMVVVLFEGTHVPGVRARTATDVINLLLRKLQLAPDGAEVEDVERARRHTSQEPA